MAIVLIVLALLTLLGISTMRVSISELQVVGDTEDKARSFQAAEAGLTAATALLADAPETLMFRGGSAEVDFTALNPNPLAGMGGDTPTVTMIVSGERDGSCARTEFVSSADLLGCGAFDIVSTHEPDSQALRGGARTRLTTGITQQVIKQN